MVSGWRAPRRSRDAEVAGGKVDNELKQLMKELGEAINKSVAESDQIADVMARIKDGGYDVFLVLEATIGFNHREGADKTLPAEETTSGELDITSQDLKFLRSLRITVNEES
jgi:hypothetical protein